jgi:MFS family permease
MTGLTAENIETGSLHSTAMTLVHEEEPVKKRSSLRMVAIMTALCVRASSLLPFSMSLLNVEPNFSQLSLFIAALDQSILATAVPTIASEFGSPIGYVWIMSAYLLASSAAGPIWAKLSDIWGRKPIILTAVMLFLCSSVICALAPSMLVLIVGRILQGIAGGGLMVMVNITISDLLSVR